jgi:phosphohistidine phosphatase
MNLFILRHASAGLRRANPVLDLKRPLDKDGKAQCLQLAHVLNALNTSFDMVNFSQFQRLLRETSPYENVLVVGHNPNITQFLGHLLGVGTNDDPSTTPARIRLRKGSLARVSLQRGSAVLQSLIDPRVVRALYTTSTKSSRRKTSRK